MADGGDVASVGRFQRGFVTGVALLLGLTGGLKLVGVFGGYRLGRWLVGWEDPCGCLGHLLERWPEFERWADRVMLAVLAIMAGGSLWLLRVKNTKEISMLQ